MSQSTKNQLPTNLALVVKWLQSQQLQILAQNQPTNFGIVDILARDGDQLVVVQLKDRSEHRGAAIEMINPTEQRQFILLAHALQREYQTASVRIDIITLGNDGSAPSITKHYRGLIEFYG